MTIEILSPSSRSSYEADAVFLPGSKGAFEVLPGHYPIISTLEKGVIRWRKDGKEETLEINGGVVRYSDGKMQICI